MWNRLDFKKILSGPLISKYKIPILILAAGLLILALSGLFSQPARTETTSSDADQYGKTLEKSLRRNINQLKSVSDCSVMITLAATDENTYLENTTESASVRDDGWEESRDSDYLVIDSADGDTVVIASKRFPSVRGVLVVYDGEDSVTVKKNIMDAVSTVLGIQSNKVCVVSNQE